MKATTITGAAALAIAAAALAAPVGYTAQSVKPGKRDTAKRHAPKLNQYGQLPVPVGYLTGRNI
jgi:hypothetical protein